MTSQKRELRDLIRQKRGGLASGEVAQRSTAVFKQFLGAYQEGRFGAIKSAALYRPIRGEVDTRAFHEHFLLAKIKCLYPVVDGPKRGEALRFFAVSDLGTMRTGAFGILEPVVPEPASPTDTSGERPDLVLVPGLVFSASCHRLGYGGGHYDATIRAWREDAGLAVPKLAGVAYDFQVVENLPLEAHDERLDYVISESKIIDRSAS